MTDEQTARTQIARWGNMVWRLAMARTRHIQDSEDVFQEVFTRFFRHQEGIESDEHRKAWLIRCTINCTNTLLRAPWRRHLPLEEVVLQAVPEDNREIYQAVLSLPRPYRTALHLHCCEGFTVVEIAAMLDTREGTVKSWLSRGRAKLAQAPKGGE